MVSILKYYSYNSPPNDEELKTCIDIAEKSKSVVLLFFASVNLTNDCNVNHVFIHPDDTLEQILLRIPAGYSIL